MIIRLIFCLFLLNFSLEAITPYTELSIEEKVGQLLIAHFHGDDVNDEAKQLIEKAYVGGIIYYNWANTLNSPKQVQTLSNNLQKLARKQPHGIPLFISIDQEGGAVNRLNQGFTVFPGNRALAIAGDPKLAQACAHASGMELRAVGINMNFAPVVDVDSATLPVIGIRAYSASPHEVVQYGRAALQGYRQAGVIAVMKHFPGYGEVTVDPHAGMPKVNKTRGELERTEFLPFRELSKQADAVMTAHILMPAIDSQRCATLSPTLILGILREELNYEGVIISDSLIMRGVTDCCGDVAEACVQAFLAGHDLLVLGGKLLDQKDQAELTVADVQKIHQKIVEAVRSGRISEDRLNTSVRRILELKHSYYLFDSVCPGDNDIEQHIDTEENRKMAKIVAEKSVRVARNQLSKDTKIGKSSLVVIAPEALREAIESAFQGEIFSRFYFKGNSPALFEKQSILQLAAQADLALFFSYDAWKSREQIETMKLIAKNTPLAIVTTRNSLDADMVPEASAVVLAVSPSKASISAAIQCLKSGKKNK